MQPVARRAGSPQSADVGHPQAPDAGQPIAIGRAGEIVRVQAACPELNDDAFVAANLDRWLDSDERRSWLTRIAPLIEGDRRMNVVGGFAGWFPATSDAQTPLRWKQAAAVLLALFPTSLVLTVLRQTLLPNLSLVPSVLLTNVLGVAYTIRATAPALRDSKGHLLITSSVAGRRALPGSLYSSTKHAVTAMGEAARLDAYQHRLEQTAHLEQVAAAFGCHAAQADSPDGLRAALDEARAAVAGGVPAVVNARLAGA